MYVKCIKTYNNLMDNGKYYNVVLQYDNLSDFNFDLFLKNDITNRTTRLLYNTFESLLKDFEICNNIDHNIDLQIKW